MSKNEYTDGGFLYIKAFNHYVHGIVRTDIKLSYCQKIKILFCKGISVCIGDSIKEV